MTSHKFKKGDILFQQGDATAHVMLVRHGEIEVLRECGAHTIMLGQVRDNEWLGEMAVIEGRSHSAMARAAIDSEVEMLTGGEFLQWVSSDPPMARDLIRRLSIRLHEVEDKLVGGLVPFAHDWLEDGVDDSADHVMISLSASTENLRSRIGAAPIPVNKLPFVVGRVPVAGEAKPIRQPDLLIGDAEPFRLSRQHFMIARDGNRLLVSDLDSALGTIVNGQPIGHHFMADSAPLHRGENHIVAGGRESPIDCLVSVS